MPSKDQQGADDFVDPSPPARLSRRNVVALALSVAGVLLALFFSSRRAPAPVEREPEPGYVGLAPITLGPAPPPAPAPWAASESAEETPRSDPRQLSYDEARRSRPMVAANRAEGAEEEDLSPPAGNEAREIGDYTLAEASVIEAALETRVHSSRPGPVVARVTRNVYDTKHLRHVLIPAGTRLIGSLEQALEGEDGRVIVAWTRMMFPDGRARTLPGLPAMETSGEGGLRDKVKSHRASAFGSAALLALLGGSTTYAAAQTGGALAGTSLALEMSRMATTRLGHPLRRRPTVIIRPGYRFLVYVSEDLDFEGPR